MITGGEEPILGEVLEEAWETTNSSLRNVCAMLTPSGAEPQARDPLCKFKVCRI
jgi:hypothetical protein